MLVSSAASAAIQVSIDPSVSMDNVQFWNSPGALNEAVGTIQGTTYEMLLTATSTPTANDLDTGANDVAFEPLLDSDDFFVIQPNNFYGLEAGVGTTNLMSLNVKIGAQSGGGVQGTIEFLDVSANAVVLQPYSIASVQTDRLLFTGTEEDVLLSVSFQGIGTPARIDEMKQLRVNGDIVIEPQPDPPNGEIPEPSTLACWLLLGLSSIGAISRRRRKAA